MRTFRALLILIFLLACLMAAYVWSGTYNVAASVPHWGATHWLLEVVRDRSITEHSKAVAARSLKDPKLEETGVHHYHASCRLCHGAPGYSKTEFAQGLYPGAPNLVRGKVQQEWNDAELFWIVKNGLKLTGMPAFGPTHDDDEIWGIVAFVRKLKGVSIKEYAEWLGEDKEHGAGEDSHHHDEGAHQ